MPQNNNINSCPFNNINNNPNFYLMNQNNIVFNNNINNNNLSNNNKIIHEKEKEIINILENAEYKLSGFGISKRRNDIIERKLEGSPLYMSPELINPSASIKSIENYQVDIWALGVLAFEMFFGRRPFEAFSIEELNKMYENKTYYINLNSKCISKEFFSFLNMCLQKDPEKRADVKKLQNSEFCCCSLDLCNKMDKNEFLEMLGDKVKVDEKNGNIYLSIDEIYFKDEDI